MDRLLDLAAGDKPVLRGITFIVATMRSIMALDPDACASASDHDIGRKVIDEANLVMIDNDDPATAKIGGAALQSRYGG